MNRGVSAARQTSHMMAISRIPFREIVVMMNGDTEDRRSGRQTRNADSHPIRIEAANAPMAGPVKRRKPPQVQKSADRPAESSGGGPSTAHRWTFLTNHAHVLIALHGRPGLILREVAEQVGITERAVQRIVQELEEGGYIRREKVGRRNQYEVLTDQPLRHSLEAHRSIGDLLQLMAD